MNTPQQTKTAKPGVSALFTDFYELTMAQGFWKRDMNRRACFDMFFRRHPFDGGFSIFAGLETLLEKIRLFRFSEDDLVYLDSLGLFEPAFLAFLRDFHFNGTIWAQAEGSVVFPQEPLLRVDAKLIEAQIIEGLVLNTINFQSLIATKTARVNQAICHGDLMEFGLRRAQGPDGAFSATRAAYIGGADGTSNTEAGRLLGIPVRGTMAHSWVMSFPNELDAFRAYADMYPDTSVFLIDTYDTLGSGIGNAITVGKELAARGKNFGVRLDSGDIHYLSTKVRKRLDEAGLKKAFIAVSNDLDETIIQTLSAAGAPVDSWGVGTQMVTGRNEAAFTGVYKLAALDDGTGRMRPVMKFSDNPEKTTNPGIKQLWRLFDSQGMAVADILSLVGANGETDDISSDTTHTFWHPQVDYRHFRYQPEGPILPLLKERLREGKPVGQAAALDVIRKRVETDLAQFDDSYKRFLNPHIYKVSISDKLKELKLGLIRERIGDL